MMPEIYCDGRVTGGTEMLASTDLAALDAAMTRAFATGDASGLEVLGYGEISTVVGCMSGGRRWACKRLPPFPATADADRYAALFQEYLATLAARGVRALPSVLQRLDRGGGTVVIYCVQPLQPAAQLAVQVLERSDPAGARALFETVLERIVAAVTPQVGLDGQLSNWVVEGDDVLLLDVTTPMLKDAAGRNRLDMDLFIAAVPAPARPLFRRYVVPSVIDKYHDPRGVTLDLLANLIKDGLDGYIEPFLVLANRRLSPPLDVAEVRRYYAGDARVWTAWQALRRCDRFVRTRLLGRPYPFLLPGRIERRG
jgi:hypothetical protein